MGEPYGRQLHRITKGTTLGKICLVEPYHGTKEDDALVPHLDFTFVGVDTKSGHLDVADISGNMISAIGPYAYNEKLLPPGFQSIKDGEITIAIRNTNTMKLVESTISVSGGQAAVTGKNSVDGVNGKGSSINLAFRDIERSATGKTFPTGRVIDVIDGHQVTCVDGATPVVFIRADSIGVPGGVLPHELTDQKAKLNLLEKIRRIAAVNMGIANAEDDVPRTVPKIAIVSQSSQHVTVGGVMLKMPQMDIVIRFISDSEPHHAIPLMGAITTAVAARMPGTVVEELLAPELAVDGMLTIAHPSGRTCVKIDYDTSREPATWVGHVSTTAKRLFWGKTYWTDSSSDKEADLIPSAEIVRHSLGLAFVNELRLPKSPAGLVERFYQDGHDTTSEVAPQTKGKSTHRPQSSSSTMQLELQLPTPSTTRDKAHLLRELSTLRNSLTHFSSLYPSPNFPRARPEIPIPSGISYHLAAIAQHINILTTTLAPMPRAPSLRFSNGGDAEKGAQWHRWAKTFSQWDKVRSLREAEQKKSKKETRKSGWARWRDGELNALSKRGRPVVMGAWRRKLLESRGP